MKKIFILFASLLVFVSTAFSQQTQAWSTIAKGISLPSNIPRAGYMFFRTSDSLIFISTGLTWVEQSSAVSAGGDISSVTAGNGLNGGGASGAVTLNLNPKLTGQTIAITSDSAHVKDASITTTQVATNLKQLAFKFSFLDTVLVGDSLMVAHESYAITIDSIWAVTNTGTATLFFDHRVHTTPRTRGTNIETGGIVADAYESSAAFDDATIPANASIFCRVTAVADDAKQLWVTIFAKKD